MKDFGDCETAKKNSKIVLVDPNSQNPRSKFCLDNPKKAKTRVIQVDDCAIKQGIRCEYLIILPNEQELYVELKGSNVEHAVEQIATSIQRLTSDTSALKLGFIASTRCPINSTEIQILKKKFRQQYKAKLIIKNGEITHKV